MKNDNHKFSIAREGHPLFFEPILIAKYKSCECHLEIFGKALTIQFIESEIKNQGHATGMIKNLLGYAKKNKFELVSSVAISPVWKHLADKFRIRINCYLPD